MKLRTVALTIALHILWLNNTIWAMEQIHYEIYPEGVAQVNPINVDLTGKIYVDSWWFDEVKAGKFPATADEMFIIKDIDANTNGTLEEQLLIWPQDERQDINNTLSDPIIFAGNQGYYKLIQYSAFLAKIAYGPYLIFFIQHSGPEIEDEIKKYPVVQMEGTYYLTNKMMSDPIFNFLMEEVKKHLTLKVRPTQPDQTQP